MTLQFLKTVCIAMCLVFLSCAENKEQPPDNTMQNAADKNTTVADSEYIANAYSAGLFEIELSEHAKTMFTDEKVKSIAEKMVIAHSELNGKLKELAAKKNIPINLVLTKEQNEEILAISYKSGSDFDKAYINRLISDHEAAVNLFEKASQNASDEDVKKIFTDALPEIRNHLEMAKGAVSSI
jgi:putative membrane protein